ncbi:hypothetical protein COR50_15805 [Chitinophaga caeni]|uniref:Uncharacterized protein n=1 Tax=Chitinophaga caeni TaxID=2029983 RepID=A0A291QX51_9BACT|nr:hypothetical protein COR50_15805 [Chitinophaga caeni]
MATTLFLNLYTLSAQRLQLDSKQGTFILDKSGKISYFGPASRSLDNNLLHKDSSSYLLQIKRFSSNEMEKPTSLNWKKKNGKWKAVFHFNENFVELTFEEKDGYLTAEATAVKDPGKIELLEWGKIYTPISDSVGQSLGVAYNSEFAIGILGLNLKSQGGFEINHRERFGNAAQRFSGGTVLQGFTRNRGLPRVDNNFIQELTFASPLKDGDARLQGSKFAFYCVKTNDLLKIIHTIEMNEGLPVLSHADGWIKTSKYATSSKFIMSYDVNNIDACLDLAEKAGITNVYHPGIFKTWGTFKLDSSKFPMGTKSIAALSEKAKARNITLGAHALSNFITTNDPLVSPIPHPDLQLAGVTVLKQDIDTASQTIILRNAGYIKAYSKDNYIPTGKEYNVNRDREIFAIRIGNEIIEYSDAVQQGNDIVLSGCKRGAFNTAVAAHQNGDRAGRLASHAYKVFFANIILQDTVAQNLARFFNEAKLKRISFDGVEGGVATGHNRYSCERFVYVFFRNLVDKNIVANSSDLMHYAWHYFSNESWGEPWWAKNFRESQLDHRLAVQQELKEDLMPRKMGQFSLTNKTTLKDINWLMGLCAGYDSGVDFYVSPDFEKINPAAKEILNTIKKWEIVRNKQTLSGIQKKQLRDVYTLYSLSADADHPQIEIIETWAPEQGKLQQEDDRNTLPVDLLVRGSNTIISFDYHHKHVVTEPGLPTHSELKFYSVAKEQELMFAARLPVNAASSISGLYLKSGARKISLPFKLNPGDYILLDQDQMMRHFDKNGRKLDEQEASGIFDVKKGNNLILVDYDWPYEKPGPEVIINFKINK